MPDRTTTATQPDNGRLTVDLKAIETRAAEYAEGREELKRRVDAMLREVARLKRQARPGIEEQLERVTLLRQELHTAIDENRHLFKKPKSRLFHGIKLGLRKLTGKVTWDDKEAVIRRIRDKLSEDQADLLIRKKEDLNKQALGELTVADLKRIGCSVTEDEDVPFITAADTDLDKWIESILANEEEIAEEDDA